MLISLTVSPGGGAQASSIGVYSDAITFTLDTNYTVGTYWNGDPWVLRPGAGSVTITATSPTALGNNTTPTFTGADRVRHGTVLNWNTGAEAAADFSIQNGVGALEQGWDSYDPVSVDWLPYETTRQVDPALTGSNIVVSAEGSVMKAISNPDGSVGNGRGSTLTDVGLLSVVDSAPPSNAFRPGAHTLTKAHRWTLADVDYSLVPSGLTAPASAPTYASAMTKVGRHHIMGALEYDKLRTSMPQNHMGSYGADNARHIADALLLSMTDAVTAQERETLINSIIQIGIDVYDRYNEGGRWHPAGGLYCGYKLPLVLAATLLDDAGLKAVAAVNPTASPVHDAFCEDRQIWYLTSADTGRTLDAGNEQYLAGDEGDPEWGEQHTEQSGRDDRDEWAAYRDINTRAQIGAALAGQMVTGVRTNWNWQAYFDYADRVMERDFFASGETLAFGGTVYGDNYSGSNPIPTFQKDMWSSFRASYGGAIWNR